MKITNNSGKIIGIGVLTLLPGETELLPKEFEKNPIILGFAEKRLVKLVGSTGADAKAAAEAKAKEEAESKAAAEAKTKEEAESKAAAEAKTKEEAEAKAAPKAKAEQQK